MEQILGKNTALVMIGGREFELAPATIGMLSDLARFFKQKPIRDCVSLAREIEMEKDLYRDQLAEIQREVARDNRSMEKVMDDNREDPDGLVYLLYLRIRHAGVTLEQVRNFPVEDVTAAAEIIMELGIGPDGELKKKASAATAGTP